MTEYLFRSIYLLYITAYLSQYLAIVMQNKQISEKKGWFIKTRKWNYLYVITTFKLAYCTTMCKYSTLFHGCFEFTILSTRIFLEYLDYHLFLDLQYGFFLPLISQKVCFRLLKNLNSWGKCTRIRNNSN